MKKSCDAKVRTRYQRQAACLTAQTGQHDRGRQGPRVGPQGVGGPPSELDATPLQSHPAFPRNVLEQRVLRKKTRVGRAF